MPNVDFKFYAITDRKRLVESLFLNHLDRAVSEGVRAIQIREKDLSPKALYELCDRIKTTIGPRDVKLFVNDRADIALTLDLDGVHLTEQSLPVYRVRKIMGPDKFVGVSVHDLHGAIHAENEGADFIVLGPVEKTNSKPDGKPISEELFQTILSETKIPVFALGGITPENASAWIRNGAFGVAGISLWMEPKGFTERLQKLKTILGTL